MRSNMVIDKINDMKMKFGQQSHIKINWIAKVDSEPPAKTTNSAKQKRVEDAVDEGHGDDRLPGTSKMMTDVVMVPPILMAGLRPANYKPRGVTALLLEQR